MSLKLRLKFWFVDLFYTKKQKDVFYSKLLEDTREKLLGIIKRVSEIE